ncbi:hypothetical protein [Streptomyces ficellus]|uniref:Uncharacterized protein n=1 Tax=Streptomyces ficellus TaxID=1977088 RepID=A0A6I6FT20_9ACTN|nr:hypothetical protein [Streptomyces ficellus]QGV80908.1 hypothetical protein EIZ62_23685 [Streptomyces ficellus]
MAGERDTRPIAHGTWLTYSGSRELRPPEAERFDPVDTRPEATSGTTRALRFQDTQRRIGTGSAPPAVAVGTYVAQAAMDAHKDRKREKAARTPHHSVREAAAAAGAYHRSVLAHCLAGTLWPQGHDSDAYLVSLVPELAEPLNRLTAAAELEDGDDLMSWSEAKAITDPLLQAARDLHALVVPAFRVLPPGTLALPMIGTRITTPQRARALRTAVDVCDRGVAAWYGFVFTGEVPTAPLAAVAAELDIDEAAERLTAARRHCLSLADTPAITRAAGTTAVRELRDAFTSLAKACYAASSPVENVWLL